MTTENNKTENDDFCVANEDVKMAMALPEQLKEEIKNQEKCHK